MFQFIQEERYSVISCFPGYPFYLFAVIQYIILYFCGYTVVFRCVSGCMYVPTGV